MFHSVPFVFFALHLVLCSKLSWLHAKQLWPVSYLITNNNYNYYNHFMANFSGTTWVRWYQKKHSLTHTYPDHQSSFISFFHLLWSIASSLFKLRACQSFCTISLQVLFGLPLCLTPSTLYCINFCTKSLSSFRNTCPYHHSLFCCSTKIMPSNPSLSLSQLFTWNSIL